MAIKMAHPQPSIHPARFPHRQKGFSLIKTIKQTLKRSSLPTRKKWRPLKNRDNVGFNKISARVGCSSAQPFQHSWAVP